MYGVLVILPYNMQAANKEGSAGNDATVEFYLETLDKPAPVPVPPSKAKPIVRLPQTGEQSAMSLSFMGVMVTLSGGYMLFRKCQERRN